MSLTHWLAFFVASNILLAVPGPTVLVVVSYALGHGRRPAAAVVAGVSLGDFTAMTCSMLGLGAIMAASAMIYTGLRWVGGLYLIYLGFKLWRTPVAAPDAAPVPALSLRRIFAHAYAVTALNPKSIVFFIAFVPQFIDTAHPFWPQVAILEATFVSLAAINAALYGWLAAKARDRLRSPKVQRAVTRSGGAALMGRACWPWPGRTASRRGCRRIGKAGIGVLGERDWRAGRVATGNRACRLSSVGRAPDL